jgi:hypothetical protein
MLAGPEATSSSVTSPYRVWPRCPALPDAPVRSVPSTTKPPPMPVETTIDSEDAASAAAPIHDSARARQPPS